MASLRSLRRRARLTQLELAGRAGLEVSTIARLERGVMPNPTKQTLEKLAHGLGVPPLAVWRAHDLSVAHPGGRRVA
jgi:transcriptional regulator with XRE-family HTH domain